MDLDPQKLLATPLVAGLVGACLGLKSAPGVSWSERLINVLGGSACAGFVAPAAGEMFKLSTPSMLSCLSFFLGMFGMSLVSAIMAGLREVKVGQIIQSWFSRGGR